MQVSRFPDAEEAADHVARRIAGVAHARKAVLGLPTGRTPLPVYRRLGALHRAGALDVSGVQTFNLDEFVGLSGQDAGSFRAYMDRHLFGPVGLPERSVHFLDGRAEDLAAECRRYDAELEAAGGLDLLLLGLGVNGHLAFNEPADTFVASTHRVTLSRATREANLGWFGGDVAQVPREALTLGMRALFLAREVVVLATGAAKAPAARAALEGPVTPRLPASLLQLHPRVEWVLDVQAAGG